MSKNPIDQELIGAFERHGGRGPAFAHLGKKILNKLKQGAVAAKDKMVKAPREITKAIGAQNLSKFAGQKMARMAAPADRKKYVEQSVSGKDALKGAGNLAMTIGSMAAPGVVSGVTRATKPMIAKKLAKRRVDKILNKSKNIKDRMNKMPDYSSKTTSQAKKNHDVAKK